MKYHLTYFKKTGKLYSSDVLDAKGHMYEVFALVREMRSKGRLPGLIDRDDGGHEGFIVHVAPDGDYGYPGLII